MGELEVGLKRGGSSRRTTTTREGPLPRAAGLGKFRFRTTTTRGWNLKISSSYHYHARLDFEKFHFVPLPRAVPDAQKCEGRSRLSDKTNPPSEGMSLNRSQRGNCSTEYNTPPGT